VVIFVNLRLIKGLIKNCHDYVQDSEGIAHSEILLILGVYDLIKINLSCCMKMR
jgi:hypothetical protein